LQGGRKSFLGEPAQIKKSQSLIC